MDKAWTVLVYIVAEPPPRESMIRDLNAYYDAELAQIKAAAQRHAGIHVAYQIDYEKPDPAKRERPDGCWGIVGDDNAFGPYAPVVPGDESLRRVDDLNRFLLTAVPKCPANYYALLCFGHGFGPAGVWEREDADEDPGKVRDRIGEALKAPFRRHWLNYSDRKYQYLVRANEEGGLKGPPQPGPARPGRPDLPGREVIVTNENFGALLGVIQSVRPPRVLPGTGVPRLEPPPAELVVFKDCYMSCLEVACALEDKAQFVIGSQSQLPFNKNGGEADEPPSVWDYDRLFDCLVAPDKPGRAGVRQIAANVLDELQTFYSDRSNCGRFPGVPLTLLDLAPDCLATVRSGLSKLADALGNDPTAASRAAFRGAATGPLFEKKDAEARGPMRPGNAALVDVETLCESLVKDPDAGVAEAAGLLGGALRHLVAKSTAAPGDCCRGVSIFYHPSATATKPEHEDDLLLAEMVHKPYYRDFRVNKVGDGEMQPAVQWVDIAFEQVLAD